MDDPVKGEGRMITDANGITRREEGFEIDSRCFSSVAAGKLVNKISETIDYEPIIGVIGKTGEGKSSVCNAQFNGKICAVSDVESCTREA